MLPNSRVAPSPSHCKYSCSKETLQPLKYCWPTSVRRRRASLAPDDADTESGLDRLQRWGPSATVPGVKTWPVKTETNDGSTNATRGDAAGDLVHQKKTRLLRDREIVPDATDLAIGSRAVTPVLPRWIALSRPAVSATMPPTSQVPRHGSSRLRAAKSRKHAAHAATGLPMARPAAGASAIIPAAASCTRIRIRQHARFLTDDKLRRVPG